MTSAILILAAGASSRMGQPKQLLPFANKTLIQLSIETALDSHCKNIYCVVGANANAVIENIGDYPIHIIQNPNYQQGLSSSIKAGLEVLEKENFEAVLITLADQPKINSSHLNSLINTWKDHPYQAVATRYKDNIGVPTLFPKHYFKDLKALTGDKGARTLLNKSKKDFLAISFEELADIDTPEDYQKLLGNK